jgi:hypothetical protein
MLTQMDDALKQLRQVLAQAEPHSLLEKNLQEKLERLN